MQAAVNKKMRVLWFSPTPSLYTSKQWCHNGGGWIGSLQSILEAEEGVKLGIAFEYSTGMIHDNINNIDYYPIDARMSLKDKLIRRQHLQKLILRALEIICEFKPDVIQIFGSEMWYGLLVKHTQIPIVIHMQGSLPSYYNARYPVGMSVWNKIFSKGTSLKQKLMAFRVDSTFRKNALQEEGILKANRYFIGRTHWDRAIVEFYNPEANYFVCNEALREKFIHPCAKWQYSEGKKIKLISVISGPLYKGLDVVLKTAYLLKQHTSLDFEWNVCGTANSAFFENVYNIQVQAVNVRMLGVLSQEELFDKLIDSTLYVHPSYIDNSPNSVCEAQILGLPVIATNVGGVSSIVTHMETGFLVPSNDPLKTASLIAKLVRDKNTLESISRSSVEAAAARHKPESIRKDMLNIYSQIIKKNLPNDY